MKNLKAKEERKSNGGQNTNGDDKCLRVETGSGGDAVKEQNGVDDRQQPWVVGVICLAVDILPTEFAKEVGAFLFLNSYTSI